jgi:hypothetical protein
MLGGWAETLPSGLLADFSVCDSKICWLGWHQLLRDSSARSSSTEGSCLTVREQHVKFSEQSSVQKDRMLQTFHSSQLLPSGKVLGKEQGSAC